MRISTAGKTENLSEMTLKQTFVSNIKLRDNAYQNESIVFVFFSFIEIYLSLLSTNYYV